MNAYFYSFGEHRYVAEMMDDRARYEVTELCGVVVAPTRGKAQALALAHESRDAALEWTDMRKLRKLCADGQGEARVVRPGCRENRRLWAIVDKNNWTIQATEGEIDDE